MNKIPDVKPVPTTKMESVDQAIELAKLMPESDPNRLELLRIASRIWIYRNAILSIEIKETPE